MEEYSIIHKHIKYIVTEIITCGTRNESAAYLVSQWYESRHEKLVGESIDTMIKKLHPPPAIICPTCKQTKDIER